MFDDFENFLASNKRNAWIREPGISIYVRRALPHQEEIGIHIHLASMQADEPGSGALTDFLNRFEPKFGFFVESILNPRLVGYLQRRKYQITYIYGVPNAVKKLTLYVENKESR